MKIITQISAWFSDLWQAFCCEFKRIIHDPAVLLFFIVLPLAYPIVYTLIYNPEVVRDIPIVVVDNSRSEDSRKLVQKADASPTIEVYAYAANMSDARQLMAEGKVFGIMEIPNDYAKCIKSGERADVNFYSDMSLMLRYRAFVGALTDLQLNIISDITAEKIRSTGTASIIGSGMPIESHSNFLGDTEQGFASFVIPGIVVLILHQSLILGICLLGGTARERKRKGLLPVDKYERAYSMSALWGKTLSYLVFYIPISIYILHFIPEIFKLPHIGNPVTSITFILPMLLSAAFMGHTLVIFMRERESAFIVIVFTSVIFLFLSGLTWPRFAMSTLWTWVGNCIPAVWGVEGFIRINSNAATLADTSYAWYALWILTIIYMFIARWIAKQVYCQANNKP